MAGQRLWHTRRACTTTVAQGNTRWQTKARARHRVVIWLTIDATSRCVGTNQEHSSLMDEHCLGCSTLLTFYHGIRSHAFVIQCVRVRACKHPRRGREETRWRLFVPTDMPSFTEIVHAHKKQGPRAHKQSTLRLKTLLAGMTKSARMHKHASETHAGAVNSDSRSRLNTPTDVAALGRAFPASWQVWQAPPRRRRHHNELDSNNTPDKEDKAHTECEATRCCVQCEKHAD